MCRSNTEENMNRYEGMENKSRKRVLQAMRVMAEEGIPGLNNCPVGMFRIMEGLKIDNEEIEGRRYISGSD